MAFTFGFYNSINHDRVYDALQVGQIFDGLINDGIYATYKGGLQVVASSTDNTVIIKSGRAWFNHTWSYNDSDLILSVPAQESVLDRIDAIVLDINIANTTSGRVNAITYVKGTPAAMPSTPTWTNTDTHFRYPLAYIRRHGGQKKIPQSDITNARGTSKCPFVTPVTEAFNVDNLIEQWDTQFIEWLEQKNQAYDEMLQHNGIAWDRWFNDHIRPELDGDVAGHLQLQIDNIKRFAWIYVVDKVLYVPMSAASVEDKKLKFAVAGDYPGTESIDGIITNALSTRY